MSITCNAPYTILSPPSVKILKAYEFGSYKVNNADPKWSKIRSNMDPSNSSVFPF